MAFAKVACPLDLVEGPVPPAVAAWVRIMCNPAPLVVASLD